MDERERNFFQLVLYAQQPLTQSVPHVSAGHFQDGNGSYIWSELWRMMKDGKNVYGSYGTGTSNGGMDMGDECLNKNPFSESIRELRDKFLPTGMGVKADYPGHVIFGCSTKMKVSSNWQYVSHHITKGTF